MDGVEAFRPEQWFKLDKSWIQEMFFPFWHDPRSVKLGNAHAWIALTKTMPANRRACVERNVVMVTLRIFITTIFRCRTFVLKDPTTSVSNLSLASLPVN